MLIAIHHSDKGREVALAHALAAGARIHGHDVELRALGPSQRIGGCDLACMVGVKAKPLWEASRVAGARTLILDKGYSRHRDPDEPSSWQYWRVSLDAHHPTETTLMQGIKPADRFEALGIEVKRWRRAGMHVVFAGSSEKYHNFYDLPHPNTYAYKIVRGIAKRTKRAVIYRPKPSWRGAIAVPGATLSTSKELLSDVLGYAHAMVTHGSNACFEAAVAGIPTIILGNAVMKPISSTSLDEIEAPRMEKRARLLQNLAYHQWTLPEFQSGEAWETIEEWFNAEP